MKFIRSYQCWGILSLLFVAIMSCEDVIDVQISDAPTQWVVDAWLTNQPESQIIKLGRSQPYFMADRTVGVAGAHVQLLRSDGAVFTFVESAPGEYVYDDVNGLGDLGSVGDGFRLEIVVGGDRLAGETLMFPVPEIDSISQEFRSDFVFGPDGIYAQFFARDLPGLGNTYWIKTFKNGAFLNKPQEMNFAFDAGLSGGTQIDGIVFITPIREAINPIPDDFTDAPPPWQPSDEIRVEIHSMSLDAFDFMTRARDQILNGSNGIFAAPLANSKGNIRNESSSEEVLGVFNVAAVSGLSKTIE